MLALPEPSQRLLLGIEQHRQLTTLQLRDIYAPATSLQSVRRHLRELLRRRLAAFADVGSPHHRDWYLTKLGARLTGSEAPVLSDEQGAGPLRLHTWGVNEVGLSFLQAARVREHDFQPEDWRHEVQHPLSEGGRRQFKADALLDYRIGSRRICSFLEFDNGSKQVARLVEQLVSYASFRRGERWRQAYRQFPSVLVILAGKPRPSLESRLRVALGLAAQDPELSTVPLSLSFALLEDLQRRGPFAPVFQRPGQRPERVNWRGEPEPELKVMG